MKESQGLAKIPDTLIMAMEFINMSTPSDQAEGLEELRKTTLRLFPELKVLRLDTMVLTDRTFLVHWYARSGI